MIRNLVKGVFFMQSKKEEVVGFVFGGDSAEREVSIITMLQVKRFADLSS